MDLISWTSGESMGANTVYKAEPNLEKNELSEENGSLDLINSQCLSLEKKYKCAAKSEESKGHKRCPKLRKDREKLRQEKELLRREKQALRANRELLQAERKALDADKEIVKADKDALQAEKEVIKARKHMLKCESDALKAERRALEGERKELEAERVTLKAQLAVLKAERFSLESERALLLSELSMDQKRIQGSDHADSTHCFNGNYDGDEGTEVDDSPEDGVTDLCVQFGEPSTSSGVSRWISRHKIPSAFLFFPMLEASLHY